MGSPALEWVPDGAWLAPGYAEWAPPAAVGDVVACLWAAVVPDDADRRALVLPDACSDLIWQRGTGALVAGPDTGPVPTLTPAGTVMVGVRFRPPAGGPVLGVPLSEIRDLRVDLADLLPAAARMLPASLDARVALERALDVACRLACEGRPDPAIIRATAILRDPAARVEQVAGEVDLSLRQLRRRFHAAVGYGPKTLQRVYRFQRFVRAIDASAGTCDLAAAAAQAGYADQSHLTRECADLSGLTPAALARTRGGGLIPLLGVRGIGDHGGANVAEAQAHVDPRDPLVGRGQEHHLRSPGDRVSGERRCDARAKAALAAGRQHADAGDLSDPVDHLVAAGREGACRAERGGQH
jgi:AraC-like DNA-binding protein